eukprot:gene25588-31274_t
MGDEKESATDPGPSVRLPGLIQSASPALEERNVRDEDGVQKTKTMNKRSSQNFGQVIVECYFKVYALTAVDTKTSSFDCDFLVALDWIDPKVEGQDSSTLNWEDEEKGLFFPSLEVQNAQGSCEIVGDVSSPRLGDTKPGHVKLTQRFRASLQSSFALQDFPFDQQLLRLTVKVRATGGRKLRSCRLVHPSSAGLRNHSEEDDKSIGHSIIRQGNFVPDWKVLRLTGIEEERRDCYTLAIQVKRLQQSIAWNIAFLFMLIEGLLFVAFGVEADKLGDRMSINLTLLLTAIAFKYVVKEELPNVPYLTAMDKYILFGLFLMFLQGMENYLAHELYIGPLAIDTDKFDAFELCCVYFLLICFFLQNALFFFKWCRKNEILSHEDIEAKINECSNHRMKNCIQ